MRIAARTHSGEVASSATAVGEAVDTAHTRQLAVGGGRGLRWEVLEQVWLEQVRLRSTAAVRPVVVGWAGGAKAI